MSERASPPRAWHRMVLRAASSRAMAALLSFTLHHLDVSLVRLSGGRRSLTGLLTGIPVVLLTSRGARSGRPRTVPLLAIPDGERVVLVASNWGRSRHPAWYHNLRAHPRAALQMGGGARTYLAREATEAERDDYWRRAVQLYAGYAAYRRRAGDRRIPIVVLEPGD